MKSEVYRVFLGIFMVLILSISAIPTNIIPALGFRHADKIAHFFEYSILGFLAVQSFKPLNGYHLFYIFYRGQNNYLKDRGGYKIGNFLLHIFHP